MKNRNNSVKVFNGFKKINQSIFYDICINAIDKSNENIYNKKNYIKKIKILKTDCLNENKRHTKCS